MGTSAIDSTDPNVGHENTAPPPHTNEEQPAARANLREILERFSDSLSMVAVATTALVCGQDRMKLLMPSEPGEAITTLERGVIELRGVYEELDLAVTMEVAP